MLTKSLALKLFDAFSIQRWNDRIRPIELNEMDRSGFKMVLAYFFGKMEEAKGVTIKWDKIVFSGVFELLKKIMLSDIKAPVHRRIRENHPEAFNELNTWVVEQYDVIIKDKEFLELFSHHLNEKENLEDISYKILRAAHKYSTLREFEIIKHANSSNPNLYKIEQEINKDILDFLELEGMKHLISKQKMYDFICLVEQLRFQVRWSQTQRIPKTSVLGHSMLVATLALLLTRDLNPCLARIQNNFFCGLFHDLPEAVTRDIISPVKRATKDLPKIVEIIENEILEVDLFPLIDESIVSCVKYLTKDEFKNRIILNGEPKEVGIGEISKKYNENEYMPIDGELIKLCDEIAALLEADQSIKNGVSTLHLRDGRDSLLNNNIEKVSICGLDMRCFFNEFRS